MDGNEKYAPFADGGVNVFDLGTVLKNTAGQRQRHERTARITATNAFPNFKPTRQASAVCVSGLFLCRLPPTNHRNRRHLPGGLVYADFKMADDPLPLVLLQKLKSNKLLIVALGKS